MGWTKINDLTKPHHCRKPRATRRHGHNSQWTCDTCGKKWELHRRWCKHWNPYGAFCDICGPSASLVWPAPAKRAPIESSGQREPIEGGGDGRH